VQQMRIEIRRVLADTAYGGIASRLHLRSLGVELVAPPPAGAPPGERLSKNEFDIDFERQIATCPNGTSTDRVEQTLGNVEKIAYRWPAEACAACPLQSKCLDRPISVPEDGKPHRGRPSQGKRLVLDPLERERREARAQWADPAVRAVYVQRSTGERLHVELIQHGARLARAHGRAAAELQVHMIAMTVNLGILARNLAAMLGEDRLCSASGTPPRRRPAATDTGRQLPLVA
jgi:Transposase DDE domain